MEITRDCKNKVIKLSYNSKPCDGLSVLGVWVDKGLTYHKHAQRAAEKAILRLNCTLRIAQSIWGLIF